MKGKRPVVALISLGALTHNLRKVREYAPESKVMAVIKANAYGHGLTHSLAALSSADGFALIGLDAAIQVKQAYPKKMVVLLDGPFEGSELQELANYGLVPVIHSAWQLDLLEAEPAAAFPIVIVKFNTGMNRLGFSRDAGASAYRRLSEIPGVKQILLMSHLACADDLSDDFTRQQLSCFLEAIDDLPGERTLANSAGVVGWPETHGQWVRPGIMLYGASPIQQKTADEVGILPVMTLQSRLICIQNLKKGESVGYGRTWYCPEDMSVGIVACGYGDGYPRHAPTGTPVLVNGNRCQLVGRVSMDTLMVDLRGVGAALGDPVILWGQGLPVEQIAAASGTISYELLSGVSSRVPRRLVDDGWA